MMLIDHDQYWYEFYGESNHAMKKGECKICHEREGNKFTLLSEYDNRPKKPFWKIWK